MFNINIYQKYKVLEIIKDCYKSYDSCDDNWFKDDEYTNEYELNGIDLINKINQKLTMQDFSDFQINNEGNVINGECFNTLILIINTFNPSDGTGTEFKYYIRELKESGE